MGRVVLRQGKKPLCWEIAGLESLEEAYRERGSALSINC
jgi:hypothetical protein